MSGGILDLMTQKALSEEYVGLPDEAMAAVGGIYAQCEKELPKDDFDKIMKVSGMQANIIVKKYSGKSAKEVWESKNLDPAKLKDFVHECTTIIRQASGVDPSKALAPVA